MKHHLASLVFLVAIFVCEAAPAVEGAATTFPPHTIPNSQLRVLPRNAAGRQYQLHIGLPSSYAQESTRRYPVVFVTDAYWDFQKLTAIRDGLSYDKYAPEFIVVGMGYAGEDLNYSDLRRWELLPVPIRSDDKGEVSGHAADFLRTIEMEFIPFVEREYRVDSSHRVLAGASFGGLFTLYAMYTKPELFQAYVAATPTVHAGDDWLFGYEETFAKAGRSLKARLYMTVGGNESVTKGVPSRLRFNQRITSRKYDGFAYEFRIIEGERHGGVTHESYQRGLRFAFAPLAPESGPSP